MFKTYKWEEQQKDRVETRQAKSDGFFFPHHEKGN
jgi:hypothetical protein